MDEHVTSVAAAAAATWTVIIRGGRLIFVDDQQPAHEIAVILDGVPRWQCDGHDITFDEALGLLPASLHGWAALAACIAVRQSLSGLMLAAALPVEYQDWNAMSRRAAPLGEWLHRLADLKRTTEIPSIPAGIFDGLESEQTDSE
jgi:hypothetical protein